MKSITASAKQTLLADHDQAQALIQTMVGLGHSNTRPLLLHNGFALTAPRKEIITLSISGRSCRELQS